MDEPSDQTDTFGDYVLVGWFTVIITATFVIIAGFILHATYRVLVTDPDAFAVIGAIVLGVTVLCYTVGRVVVYIDHRLST